MTTRRCVLAGLAGIGASSALPVWGQAIVPQSDPWAQVDPYADPRNGFSANGGQSSGGGFDRAGAWPASPAANPGDGVFQRGARRQVSPEDENDEIADALQSFEYWIEQDGGRVADPRIQKAMQNFIAPLARMTDRAHLPWSAQVARSSDVNAWTVGGGKMSFNAGLIAVCDHPGELAAVVAHEMAHVDCLHAMMRAQSNRTLAAANDAGMLELGRKSADILIPGASEHGVKTTLDLLRAGFSRENEYEADEHSVELLRRLGIDPAWSVVMMSKLARQDHEYGHHLVNEALMSHPRATERADNLARHSILNRPPQGAVTLPGWEVLKAAYPTPPKWRNA